MLAISRRRLAETKLEQLKKGYGTYAETKEVARLIEAQLAKLPLNVHIDRTPVGCWYVPEESEGDSDESSLSR